MFLERYSFGAAQAFFNFFYLSFISKTDVITYCVDFRSLMYFIYGVYFISLLLLFYSAFYLTTRFSEINVGPCCIKHVAGSHWFLKIGL